MNKEFSLVIATPFYSVTAFAPYIVSLIDTIRALDELKVKHTYYQVTGDSYVDRAKNAIVHQFLKSDYTHLFMVDSDEAWDVAGFARVLRAAMSGCEVVGAAYPCKNNWEFYGCIPKYEEEDGKRYVLGKEENGMRLLDMWGIPGGFLIYSREAFERARPNLNTYEAPETGEKILEAFRCNIEPNGGRIGEDIYFQQRYKEMGGTVWLEPDVTIEHYGVKGWKGNYHEFLLKQKAENDQSEALGSSAEETMGLLKGLKEDIEGYDYLGDITRKP